MDSHVRSSDTGAGTQSLAALPDGSVALQFGQRADGMAGRVLALVVHLHSRDPRAAGKAAKLSPSLEARPVTSSHLRHAYVYINMHVFSQIRTCMFNFTFTFEIKLTCTLI